VVSVGRRRFKASRPIWSRMERGKASGRAGGSVPVVRFDRRGAGDGARQPTGDPRRTGHLRPSPGLPAGGVHRPRRERPDRPRRGRREGRGRRRKPMVYRRERRVAFFTFWRGRPMAEKLQARRPAGAARGARPHQAGPATVARRARATAVPTAATAGEGTRRRDGLGRATPLVRAPPDRDGPVAAVRADRPRLTPGGRRRRPENTAAGGDRRPVGREASPMSSRPPGADDRRVGPRTRPPGPGISWSHRSRLRPDASVTAAAPRPPINQGFCRPPRGVVFYFSAGR
jgi:hypothetical protein